jgi:GNAT superfamily N-acetyltransferase
MTTITVRSIEPHDRDWVVGFLRDRWGSERQVANSEVFYPADHPGFIALIGGMPTGLITYRIAGDACEITLIDAGSRHEGVGTTLLEAAETAARGHCCSRMWLVTTNDNLDALRFYQRRGFVLTALRPNALERSRAVKPEIPTIGEYGIPLRDELVLEKLLQ